jgi:hypothetical protein
VLLIFQFLCGPGEAVSRKGAKKGKTEGAKSARFETRVEHYDRETNSRMVGLRGTDFSLCCLITSFTD